MVDVNTSYPDFSAGEVSPRMRGRHDLAAFYNGARRVENFITQTTGPASYRTGTVYAATTAGNAKAFLYPFQYSDQISYIMEFTPLKLRFYTDGGRVHHTGQAITGITKANPAVVTYSGADYANGQSVFISGVVGMTEVNNREFTVANVNTGANTFELSGVNSSAYGTYSSGGTVEQIVEVTTPYGANDLFSLKFAQTGADVYIAHPLYAPRKLTYTSATSWSMAAHAAIHQQYGDAHVITGITQANPAVVTYTGSDDFSNGDTVLITGVSGMTQVNDLEFEIANVNTGSNTFQLVGINSTGYGAYLSGGIVETVVDNPADFLSSGKYPAAVGFYEQRLVYGGSTDLPNTLYFSRPADLDNFTTNGAEIDDGIEYTIAGGAAQIQWLKGTSKFLAVGALTDIFQVTGGIDGVITPESISIKPTNSFGSASINPIGKGTQVFFTQGNRLVLRSFEFDFAQDSYIPVDRNTISDHITKSGITQIDYQEGRPNIVWASKTNGELIGMTVEEGEKISGWHRHTTDGEIVSVASLPRSANYDQLWVCVKRTIDGATMYYIEYFADIPEIPARDDYIENTEAEDDEIWQNLLFEAQKQYIHVDSAISYYGDDAATVTLTPAATTGAAVTFTAGGSVFTSDMVGRELWRKSVTGAETGRARIDAYTSGTQVTCEILEVFDSTDAIPVGEWYLTSDEFSGLDHLEGKTVVVVCDGGQHDTRVVTDGAIILDRQSSVVHVGLKYKGYLETNDLEGGGVNGPVQTKKKAIHKLGFRFLDTLYAKFGLDYYSLEQIEMRTAAMAMDRPPHMFTGDIDLVVVKKSRNARAGGWSTNPRAIVCQDLPFPCNVQVVVPYFEVTN